MLSKQLRKRFVLHQAWTKVRSSGYKSSSPKTQKEIRKFERHYLTNLDRIGRQLRNGKFTFDGEAGLVIPKGKGKAGGRPLISSPVANRIVRRAILDVMQGYGAKEAGRHYSFSGIDEIKKVMDTPTSVGGIPKRGVAHGVSIAVDAIENGQIWFVKSDIQNFFTKINKKQVNDFVRDAVMDKEFTSIFERALETHLINEDELEERKLFTLFPDANVGVAQGSALSALAGNIVLHEFDKKMNGLGITCVRYIDDFVLFGSSEKSVLSAYNSARRHLQSLGFDAYGIHDEEAKRAGKVGHGNIHKTSVDFLGYTISAMRLQPSKASCESLLNKVRDIAKEAKKVMRNASKERPVSHLNLYSQAVVRIHDTIWGWSQSFRFSNSNHRFDALDGKIDKILDVLKMEADLLMKASPEARRRVTGVHLLADTRYEELPKIP